MQALAIGYHETPQTALTWKNTLNLSYPVLADTNGSVSEAYADTANWGIALLPWTSIVSTDWILVLSEDLYIFGPDYFVQRTTEILDSLFAPEVTTDPDHLEFTDISVGSSEQLQLVIYNGGTGLLEITDITTTHPDFTVNVTQGEVFAVEDSLVVTVTFTPSAGGSYNETLTIHSPSGNLTIPLTGTVGIQEDPELPRDFHISCYPNPFNAELSVGFDLPISQDVTVHIFNIQGSVHAQVWHGWMDSGSHQLSWSDLNAPSGLYFVRVIGEGWNFLRKVVLLR